ncbi:inner-membrane translocator, partial [Pseudomonas syringae pv. actinidiae ICMP 19079]
MGSPGLSLLASMAAAGVVSLLFALMVLVLRISQVIAGLALVFFCQGLTVGKLFVQNPLVYLTVVIFIAVVWLLDRTRTGLRLRAVGENPQAADAAGISVLGYRLAAIV